MLIVFLLPPVCLNAADVAQLVEDPSIRTALDVAKRIEPEILAEQRRVCEIAAPEFQEQKRGRNSSGSSKH
ncbi:MAG TPA: hypothetical protein VGL53_17645 [Bryobacteraceae bacterium]